MCKYVATFLSPVVRICLLTAILTLNVVIDGSTEDRNYRPGVIQIRLSPDAVSDPDFLLKDGTRSAARTGLAAIDQMLNSVGMQEVREPFYQPANTALAHELGLDRDFLVFADTGADIEALAAQLATIQGVNAAYPDWKVVLFAAPNDSLYEYNW